MTTTLERTEDVRPASTAGLVHCRGSKDGALTLCGIRSGGPLNYDLPVDFDRTVYVGLRRCPACTEARADQVRASC